MARKHKPEEIIAKLREAEIVLAQGGTVADACRRIGVTEQSYYRWRKEYGGLKMDQARRMKELEKEMRWRGSPVRKPMRLSTLPEMRAKPTSSRARSPWQTTVRRG